MPEMTDDPRQYEAAEPSSSAFTHSRELNELAAALSKAQGEIEHAQKNADNPYFKSKYADLGAVVGVVRAPFAKHGLAVVQGPFTSAGGFVIVRTRILHSSGQWIECCVQAEGKDPGPQAVGSVITYLRRYALSAMAGVASEDDDGEGAEGRAKDAKATKKGGARDHTKQTDPKKGPPPGAKACSKCGGPLRRSKHSEELYCWKKEGGCGATFPLDFETRPEPPPDEPERFSKDTPF